MRDIEELKKQIDVSKGQVTLHQKISDLEIWSNYAFQNFLNACFFVVMSILAGFATISGGNYVILGCLSIAAGLWGLKHVIRTYGTWWVGRLIIRKCKEEAK